MSNEIITTSTELTEFAECPFCHKQGKNISVEFSGYDSYRVICNANAGGCGGSTGWVRSYDKAVAVWNNRGLPTQIEAVIQGKLDEAKQQIKSAMTEKLRVYYLVRKSDVKGFTKALAAAVGDFTEQCVLSAICDEEGSSNAESNSSGK